MTKQEVALFQDTKMFIAYLPPFLLKQTTQEGFCFYVKVHRSLLHYERDKEERLP